MFGFLVGANQGEVDLFDGIFGLSPKKELAGVLEIGFGRSMELGDQILKLLIAFAQVLAVCVNGLEEVSAGAKKCGQEESYAEELVSAPGHEKLELSAGAGLFGFRGKSVLPSGDVLLEFHNALVALVGVGVHRFLNDGDESFRGFSAGAMSQFRGRVSEFVGEVNDFGDWEETVFCNRLDGLADVPREDGGPEGENAVEDGPQDMDVSQVVGIRGPARLFGRDVGRGSDDSPVQGVKTSRRIHRTAV